MDVSKGPRLQPWAFLFFGLSPKSWHFECAPCFLLLDKSNSTILVCHGLLDIADRHHLLLNM